MFRLRLTIDAQPRGKNGQPPQSTTGVARTSCSQAMSRLDSPWRSGWPGSMTPITNASNGTLSATLTQNRRVMSFSSAFSSSPVAVRGSRAMPQIGQDPGALRTIWGCIGQTYSVRAAGSGAPTGSSAMPHLGQEPGPGCRTAGCMGQVYMRPRLVMAPRTSLSLWGDATLVDCDTIARHPTAAALTQCHSRAGARGCTARSLLGPPG